MGPGSRLSIISITAALLSTCWLATPLMASAPPCPLLPAIPITSAIARPVTAKDLIGLRDFGGIALGHYSSPPAVLSPAGDRIAIQLRQADPTTNSYCVGIVVKDVLSSQGAAVVADGGVPEPITFDKYGIAGIVAGALVPPIIRWSPDGVWIAFTRAVDGVNQIWRVRADGGAEEPITHSVADIDDFQWSPDGDSLVYRSRVALAAEQARINAEGLSGYRYDKRFWPLAGARPYPKSSTPYSYFTMRIADGTSREATPSEVILLEPSRSASWPVGALQVAQSGRALAWSANERPDAYGQPARLHVRVGERSIACAEAACTNISDFWWLNGGVLVFTRREGVADSETVLYRWSIRKASPKRIVATTDIWFGCQGSGVELICSSEGSLTPRRVIAVDTSNGAVRTILDPNPEFASIALAKPERLYWRNEFGIETFGDLVLPQNHKGNDKLPLIVVQYDSRGFLRGGTGDEFPIQLLAAHGFAVLSFNRPPRYALGGPPLPLRAYLKANQKDWIDRRSVLSSLEIGVQELIDRGLVDPARIGITGQSDGATTAEFALVHSRLFSAAALSTCCDSPEMMAIAGEGYEDEYADYGYPRFDDDHESFWKFGTLKPNLSSLRPVPILIQAADQEYLLALQTYEAAREKGWPVQMFVFPNEAHFKMQPAHRLSIYKRNLDWFTHWFQNSPAESLKAVEASPQGRKHRADGEAAGS